MREHSERCAVSQLGGLFSVKRKASEGRKGSEDRQLVWCSSLGEGSDRWVLGEGRTGES